MINPWPGKKISEVDEEGKILLLIKSPEVVPKFAEIQVMTYLRLTGIQIGLLINFNNVRLVNRIKRIANHFKEE